jgi:hypothetical protein
MADNNSDSERDVERAVDALRTYYEMGQESLSRDPKRVEYGQSNEPLRKARVFAATYTERELEKLLDRCQKHNRALGITFIHRLATVRIKEDRNKLELAMIRERWSRYQLDREIRRYCGNRHGSRNVGRSPHRPKDTADALTELIRLSVKVTRWAEMMSPADASSNSFITTLDDLPKGIREQIKVLLPQLRKLQKDAEKSLKRRRQHKSPARK